MNNKSALSAVFLVVLVDLMGFGIVLPLLPFTAARFETSPLVIGLLYSIYSFAQLVFSPLWGAFSDKVGRRPIMLISTIGSTSSYILFAFSNSLPLLFLSRLLAGVMGGNIAAAQACIADVTAPSERTKGMGLLGAAFGIGFALGPALSGVLTLPRVHEAIVGISPGVLENFLSQNPYALPGFAAALLSFCSFLLVLFHLPETFRINSGEDTARIQKVSVFSRLFWSSVLSKDGSILSALYACLLLVIIGQASLYSSFPLFCKKILGMSADQVAMQFLLMGFIAILVQGGLIRHLVKAFGEKKLLIAGNILLATGLFLIPFSRSITWLSMSLTVLAIGGSLNGPTLTSLVSKEARASHVGFAMGNAQGIAALGRVLGPAWGGLLFGWHPQAPFFLTALLVSATIWIALSLKISEIP